jgi:hypothetical protein
MNDKKPRKSEVLRSLHLKLTNQSDVEQLDRFQRNSVFEGINPADKLIQLITAYNRSLEPGRTIVTEAEMLAALGDLGVKAPRQKLRRMREAGKLVTAEGAETWRTDGRSIVYDLEATLRAVKG